MTRPLLALLLVACVLTTTASAQPTPPAGTERGEIRVGLGGGYQSSSERFANEFTFGRDLETALVRTEYDTDSGPLGEVSVSYGLGKRLAVQGGVSVFTQSTRGRLSAAIPHPFFFSQPRLVELDVETSHQEIVTRVELAWSIPLVSKLQLSVSGGPAFAHLDQELVVGVDITDVFPFSTVTLTPLTEDRHGWAVGGTAAVDVEW